MQPHMDYCQCLTHSLEDVCTSIQELASNPSDFVLHRSQCCSLAKSYALSFQHVIQLLHHARSVRPDPQSHENLRPSLSELYHTMLQGHKFMRDCLYRDGWVKIAVVLALSTEAQDVCLHDLLWCLCVIHRAVEQLLVLEDQYKQENDLRITFNAIWAETSEAKDRHILLDALEHEIADCEFQLLENQLSVNSRERVNAKCHLARFLLQKVLRENDVDEHAGATCDALPSCLWVNPVEFTIKDTIGHGAYAVVYEVEWWGEMYGQKEFFGVDGNSFGREAAIQGRLRHPNLLQLICCTSKPAKNKCSLVTELMDMDLRSMICNQQKSGFDPPFSLLTGVDLMLQIAKGMEHLHSLHIMHRDLKSLNVLVSTQVSGGDDSSAGCRMRAKIADFGMSKAKNESSKFTTLLAGTTRWRAPEVFEINPESEFQGQSDARYTKKADVYSFAMVCYEILSGKIPFDDGGKLAELHQRLLRGDRPTLPPSCPRYLASYIERCWHGDPGKRPSFAQISRTLRHLKGILLMSADPFSSSVLSGPSCTLQIEDKLEQVMGANRVPLRSMTILFEMSWYKVMESRLTEQEETSMGSMSPVESSAAKMIQGSAIEDSTRSSRKRGCFSQFMQILFCHERRNSFEEHPDRLSMHPDRLSMQNLSPLPANSRNSFEEHPDRLSMQNLSPLPANRPTSFTYAELAAATNDFKSISSIGAGGSGTVFKGTLANGQEVAVKVLARTTQQGADEFRSELALLGSLRHPNLVPFLGFSSDSEGDRLMLVYEFMPHGDLSQRMYERESLPWAQRYKIVCGLASALNYLHHECDPQILHRDVKPSNILLDADYNVRLADFGIARLLERHDSHVTTTARGTFGYIAPEYVMTLKLGTAADVYSFGVVVLELACGRRVFETDTQRRSTTVMQHVWKLYQKKRLLGAVDERLRAEDYLNHDEMRRLLLLGLACSQSDPTDRPTMQLVLRVLSGEVRPPKPARPPYGMH